MRTTIRKWGNSLALRVPRGVAEVAKLEEGTVLEITVKGSQLVLSPAARVPSLASVLAGISDENIHAEVATGAPRGRETW